MSDPPITGRIWELFGELLDYPGDVPIDKLLECRKLVGAVSPESEAELAEFQSFAEGAALGRLQEEYTRAFDMDESHSLYLGYHLLGESYKRSALLLEFKERYRAHGMEVVGELADHLPVVLRFLAICDDQHLTDEILAEAVWPTLEMMSRNDRKSEEEQQEEDGRPPTVTPPYHGVLAALRLVVRVGRSDWRPLSISIGRATT